MKNTPGFDFFYWLIIVITLCECVKKVLYHMTAHSAPLSVTHAK